MVRQTFCLFLDKGAEIQYGALKKSDQSRVKLRNHMTVSARTPKAAVKPGNQARGPHRKGG